MLAVGGSGFCPCGPYFHRYTLTFCFFWRFWGVLSSWCVVLYVFDYVDEDDNVDDNVGV